MHNSGVIQKVDYSDPDALRQDAMRVQLRMLEAGNPVQSTDTVMTGLLEGRHREWLCDA